MLVIRISGRARQVFPIIALLAREQGDKTLGELIDEKTI